MWRTLPAIALLIAVSPALAEDDSAWVGKRVILLYGTALKADKPDVDKPKPGDNRADSGQDAGAFRVYRVEQDDVSWLWLTAEKEAVRGWVKVEEVIPFEQAIDYFSHEIRAHPGTAWNYLCRGTISEESGEFDSAIADFNEAIRLGPKSVPAYNGRADAWGFKEEYDKAIADDTEAIRLAPNDATAYYNRGAAWGYKSEYDKSIADFSEVIRLEPNDAMPYAGRGNSWLFKREYDKAIADLNEAIRIDPKEASSYFHRGTAWFFKREYDKAIADLNEAIRLDPDDAKAYIANRGGAWLGKREYDKAIADYNEAVRLDPMFAAAYIVRGRAWGSQKEYDKAIADYNEAVRLDPTDATAYADRGGLLADLKKYDQALADFNEAVRLEPTSAGAYRGRAWFRATCPDEKYRDGAKAFDEATKACRLTEYKEAFRLGTLAAACAEIGDFQKAVEWQEKANPMYSDAEGQKKGTRSGSSSTGRRSRIGTRESRRRKNGWIFPARFTGLCRAAVVGPPLTAGAARCAGLKPGTAGSPVNRAEERTVMTRARPSATRRQRRAYDRCAAKPRERG